MPQVTINLLELTRQIFGIGNVSLPAILGGPTDIPNVESLEIIEFDENNPQSILGTPITDILNFPDGVVAATGEAYEGIELRDMPILEITRAKTIVKTKVQGREGVVKELIGLDDFKIIIRGLLVNNDSYDPPTDQITVLNNLAEALTALDVESNVFRVLGIDSILIESISFPPLPGFTNVQPYVLQCVSDDPLELSITDLF